MGTCVGNKPGLVAVLGSAEVGTSVTWERRLLKTGICLKFLDWIRLSRVDKGWVNYKMFLLEHFRNQSELSYNCIGTPSFAIIINFSLIGNNNVMTFK